jgi:ATP adenylyltransferase
MPYVAGPRSTGCIFCESEPPVSDRERLVVHRSPHVLVMLNRFPYAPGHLMVAPYAHAARLEQLAPEAQRDLIGSLADASRALERALRFEGLNIGANLGSAAGAGFADHLHFHLVPRWSGDTNFMTVVGETRVIPQDLERTYELLAPLFAELARP